MTPRNPKLEQQKPKGFSPAKVAARKFPHKAEPKQGKTGSRDLPRKVEQHKMKPGITSPQ